MSLFTKQIWSLVPVAVCFVLLCVATVALAQEGEPARVGNTTEGVAPNAIAPAAASSTVDAGVATTTADSLAVQTKPWFTSDFISGGELATGDFVVGPGKIEVTVKPGETVIKMMSVANRIAANKTFELSVEDMSGSANPTVPVVLLGDQNGPYTLKDNITFPDTTFTLDLNERAQIPVSITMPLDAEPGGYYGSVLVQTIQNDSDQSGATASSPIVARIGTLFFITVPGPFEKSGQVNDFSVIPNKFFYTTGPLNLGVLFENTGSMHLNPYGSITVSNLFGEEVGFVEIEPWFVLPKSLRLREVVWDRELLLGRYTVTAQINRGYDDVVDTKVIHVWVLPWPFILGLFVCVFVLFILVRFITSRFEFKRKK